MAKRTVVVAGARILTVEQLRQDPKKEYNEYEWNKMIDRYVSYGSTFYKKDAGDGYDYDRFFAVYLADGIRFFKSIGYSSSMTNNDFCRILVDEKEDGTVDFLRTTVVDKGDGEIYRYKNNDGSRVHMRAGTKIDYIYSNEF